MTIQFYGIPKCTTCLKAKKYLETKGVEIKELNLKEETPSVDLLVSLMDSGQYRPRQFFNTSGQAYRGSDLKDRIDDLSHQELAEILAADGMLIRRPFITDGEKMSLGFKEDIYQEKWF